MTPATGVPLRPLVALVVLVLVLHGLALQVPPEALGWHRPAAPATLSVRSIPGPPPAPAPIAAPVPVAAPPARSPRPSRPAAPPPSEPLAPTAAPATATAPAIAVAVPPPATWRYVATALWRGVRVGGEAVLEWHHDGGQYQAGLRIAVPPLPPREQHSAGRITPQGLAPLRFSDRTRSEQATHFERDRGRIVFSSNRPEAVLQPGAQDRLSVLLQLAAIAAADPARLAPGTSVTLQVAGARDVDDWVFTVDGEEELELPGGTRTAMKLTRLPQREYDVKLETWFAPGADYALVRLRLTPPNGEWLDAQWSGTDKR